MRILIIGAGSAGLSFAYLMAPQRRGHEITVVERNSADERAGWGVTLPPQSAEYLDLKDKVPRRVLDGRAFTYDNRLIIDDRSAAGLCTFPRESLLRALRDQCSTAGVRVRFGTDGATMLGGRVLPSYDLVVGADGSNSSIRREHADLFRPVVERGRNLFVWLGVDVPFRKLTVLLARAPDPFLAWAYKYDEGMSTFIVEC